MHYQMETRRRSRKVNALRLPGMGGSDTETDLNRGSVRAEAIPARTKTHPLVADDCIYNPGRTAQPGNLASHSPQGVSAALATPTAINSVARFDLI